MSLKKKTFSQLLWLGEILDFLGDLIQTRCSVEMMITIRIDSLCGVVGEYSILLIVKIQKGKHWLVFVQHDQKDPKIRECGSRKIY